MRPSASAVRPGLAWTAYAVGLAATGLASSLLRPSGSATSLWWPAAGIAVVGALLLPRRRWWTAPAVVLVVTGVTNWATGRPPVVALLFALANAAEATTVVALLGGRRPRLDRAPDVGRLLLACTAGAATAAVGAALAVATLDGGDGLSTLWSVAASHLSALLLIVPLVARPGGDQCDAGRVETVLQWSVHLALLGAIFRPGQDLPVAFLPLVALVWAGARLTLRAAVAQLVLSGLLVTAVTVAGWGPLAAPSAAGGRDAAITIGLVQLYITVSAGVVLTTAALAQERRRAIGGLQALALRDELTGLPNRRLLFDRLDQAARGAQHDGGAFTVLLVDLDEFKAVNDTCGHPVGDELLVTTARRLESVVRPGDTVARLGGDEFAVVCPGLAAGEAVEELLHRAEARLLQPVMTSAGPQQVGASIGVAHGTGLTRSADVVREADRSMYARKAQNRAGAVVLPRPRGEQDVPAT